MLGLITVPFAVLATIVIPWRIGVIIDDYITIKKIPGFYTQVLFLAGAIFIGYLADAVYTFSLQKTGQMAIAKIRQRLFEHSISLSRSYFDKTPIGVSLSRMTSDVEAVGESVAVGVLSMIIDIVKTIALFIFLFYLNWQLTLVIMVVIPVVYALISFLRRKLRYYFNLTRQSLAIATAYLQESLNGIKTIQLLAVEKRVLDQFKEKNFQFFKAQTKSNIYDSTLFSVIDGLTSITMVLMIWYGTQQILTNVLTIGTLIVFVNILSKIFIPIREFAQQIALIQRALSALEHIQELFSQPTEEEIEFMGVHRGEELSSFRELRFDNVSFRYGSEGEDVLKNISFRLKKNQRIALVGATGSGKTTVLKLLNKSYRDFRGKITINDVDISSIPRKEMLKILSLMQQDVYLFDESIRFNIGLGRSGVDNAHIEKSAEYVYAHEFIRELPGGYDFNIIENGSNLSAGQAQLISFARTICSDNPLILLDEATSSVDSITESLIQKAIERILLDKTVIAIAHRLSTIQNSDRILVMDKGEIVESGSHKELCDANGYYVQLLDKLEKQSIA